MATEERAAGRSGTPAIGAAGAMRAVVVLAVLAVVVPSSPAVAVTASSTTRECVDPCIQAARSALRDCVSSATGAFRDALDGCADRDPGCLAACRGGRQGCRDETSLGSDLAACELERIAATERCRNELRPGTIRRATCIDRARVRGYRCRRHAVRDAKRELGTCGVAFVECAEACAPGSPPDECRGDARSSFDAARATCRTIFRVTTGGCLGKDITCVQGCVAAEETCETAPRASLDAAIAACNTVRDDGLAACRTANPDGGQGLDECADAVWASAFACREAALQAAEPSFAACVEAYVGCVRACPPVSSGG